MSDLLATPAQHTIAAPICLEGQGLHSGRPVSMRIFSAEADFGIRFRRTDLPGDPSIPARIENVVDTTRCTALAGEGGARVSTVEHLLSALHGLGVDNALIELDGPEVPIADGSSAEFCRLIDQVGIVRQERPRRIRRLTRPVGARWGKQSAVALPAESLKLINIIVNDRHHPQLTDQYLELEIDPTVYRQELAPARTFGFLAEVEAMQAKGLIKGASMENAVVFSDTEVLTPMRFPDEMARHKVMDHIGDLALIGPIHAYIVGIRTSHHLNYLLNLAIAEALD